MKHIFLSACIGCLLLGDSIDAGAQVSAIYVPNAPDPPPEKAEVIQLTIDPTGEPTPALKYSLLPTLAERHSGNAAPFYYRALAAYDEQELAAVRQGEKSLSIRLSDWMQIPVAKLPIDEVRKVVEQLSGAYGELRTAAYCAECDWQWQLDALKGTDAITFRLKEAQDARNLARFVAVKARLEIAEKKYDDAIETMRVGYRLGQDVAKPPILICTLVGVAIHAILDEQLHALMDAPGAPNMYWAVAALPRPLINIQPAMEYELAFPFRIFPFLKDPETAEHSPEQWSNIITNAFHVVANSYNDLAKMPPVGLTTRLGATALVLKGYSRAKRELIAAGYDAVKIEKMPVGQVIAIHEARLCRQIGDEMRKWTLVPYPEARGRLNLEVNSLRQEGDSNEPSFLGEVLPIANTLLPAVQQANEAIIRRDISVAAHRVIEAIRTHAALSGGKLPKTLGEINAVPVPNHPRFDEPFPYKLEGETASLEVRRMSAPGEPFQRIDEIFEITVRKKEDAGKR